MNIKLINNINKLQPYGQSNYEPIFATMGVNVYESKIVGKNKDVIQFTFEQSEFQIKSVGFRNIFEKYTELNNPTKVDIIYTASLNEWNGNITAQLMIKDIRIAQ